MSSYKIKSGDSLSKIAKKYGISIGKIMAANDKITSADHIKAGQTITLPEQGILDRAARYINYRKSDNPYDGYKKTKKSTSTLTNPSDGGKAKLQAEKKSKKIVGNPGKGNEMTKSSIPPKPKAKGGAGFDDPVDRKVSAKKKVVKKKKSRSNISNSTSTYDPKFTANELKKRGKNPKNYMSKKNYGKSQGNTGT